MRTNRPTLHHPRVGRRERVFTGNGADRYAEGWHNAQAFTPQATGTPEQVGALDRLAAEHEARVNGWALPC